MTTVLTPSTAPSIVYGDDTQTLDYINAAGSTSVTATPIVSYSRLTVVVVTATVNTEGVILPASPQIGDQVEVYGAPGSTAFLIYGPAGIIGSGQSLIAKYIGSSTWAVVS